MLCAVGCQCVPCTDRLTPPPLLTVVFSSYLHTHNTHAHTDSYTHTHTYTHTHKEYSVKAEKFVTFGIASRPGRRIHGELLRHPLNRRLGGFQSLSGSDGGGKGSTVCRKSSYDSSSLQPVT